MARKKHAAALRFAGCYSKDKFLSAPIFMTREEDYLVAQVLGEEPEDEKSVDRYLEEEALCGPKKSNKQRDSFELPRLIS